MKGIVMAGIDKIYGTPDNWDELHGFLFTHNQDALKYLNPKSDSGEQDIIIAVFPEAVDMWLLENCKLDWVIDRIKYQYDIDQ